VKGKHIAPHTIEMAAMWAVLTRLEEPKNAGLTLLQKLKLYNGKTLPGFTRRTSRSCARRPARGDDGISRATCRTRSPTPWWQHPTRLSINPFMVLNELEAG
jgi:serine protein kinase